MQVSSAFVVIMGMGVTFVGLTCIIFLTMLMGKILSKPEAPKPAAAAAAHERSRGRCTNPGSAVCPSPVLSRRGLAL